MEYPEVVVFEAEEGEDAASTGLARHCDDLEIRAPFVVTNIHGKRLASGLASAVTHETPPVDGDQEWAAGLGTRARRSGADAIVAIGGGRCLDVAKLAAARAGMILVAVPTQLSHDGICSPVAVVPNSDGRKQSIGAIAPRAVFISVATLLGAPPESARAGIGDLLANPLALKDWALAADRGLAAVDRRAWDLSVESFERIREYLDLPIEKVARDRAFTRGLADALVLSGKAMLCSGSSRPASGGEHEISHAIDELYGGRALHGAQVAFGCLVSTQLYGDDSRAFREGLRRLGLPDHPMELGLTEDDMVEILLTAPDTRPGRFTILEEAGLDAASARLLVKGIWADD
jgi:glycerol-1-phosphate dehydrogenase [NAD(P)+]